MKVNLTKLVFHYDNKFEFAENDMGIKNVLQLGCEDEDNAFSLIKVITFLKKKNINK